MTNNEKADMYCGFGAYNNELGNYEVAIDQYEKALQVNPKMDIAWNNLGNAKKSLRQFEEALDCYQKAIDCSPERFEFHYHKGLLLIELSRYDEAKEVLLRAVKLDPENIDLNYQLASTYKVLKRYNEAITYYQKCLALSPGNPDVTKNYIGCVFSSGKASEAEELLKEHLVFPTNDISWFLVIPYELIAEDKVEDIVQYFNALKQQYDPTYFEWMKGFFFQRVGELEIAESIYRGILEKAPENPGCNFNLAQILLKKERYEEALQLVDKCILQDPSQRAYYDAKLVIIEKIKSKEDVLAYTKEMEQIFTDDPLNIWFRYGIYLKSAKKEYVEAIKVFEKVNSIQESGWSHYQIGLSYNLLNQIDHCLTHLRKAFSLDRSTREDARFFPELDVIRHRKDFYSILTNFEKQD